MRLLLTMEQLLFRLASKYFDSEELLVRIFVSDCLNFVIPIVYDCVSNLTFSATCAELVISEASSAIEVVCNYE